MGRPLPTGPEGLEPVSKRIYPRNSVGDGFNRFREMDAWAAKATRTREDWERYWEKSIEPIFGDCKPASVTFEQLDSWYAKLKEKHGIGEAGKALKIWRALYNVLAGFHLCMRGQDPSLGIRKKSVRGRTQTWTEGEAVRLVKHAWRTGYRGLACIVAVAWDSSFQPVDARTLTLAHAVSTGDGSWGFLTKRGKTSDDTLGTLSARTRLLIQSYLDGLEFELHDNSPIFRTKGNKPARGSLGGRPQAPVPYTKSKLNQDFRALRRAVFGKAEDRKLMDMRRAGAVEAISGGAKIEQLAAKMANSIDQNRMLQRTYLPVDLPSVRAVDKARKIGRRNLPEQNEIKKLKLGPRKS